MEIARPLVATNQRPMDTEAIWVVMPCPETRRANIIIGRRYSDCTQYIARHEMARKSNVKLPNSLTLKTSVSPPRQSITAAEVSVPAIYSPPQAPLDRLNSF